MKRIASLVFLFLVWASPIRTADQISGGTRLPKPADGGVSSILAPGKDWELLGRGYQLTADSAVDKDGTVYFTDARNNRILKIDPTGRITVWKDGSGGAHGIASGPDGRLYAGQHDRKRIVALDPDGKESVVAEDVQTHHLTVTKRGEVYFAGGPNHTIGLIDAAGNKRVATTDIDWPHGLQVTPDQSRLAVTDIHTRWVWTFQIQPDGSLGSGQPFYHLETRDDSTGADAGGMTFDTEGFLYVATSLGVQVFDRSGHMAAIIHPLGIDGVSDVFFAGPNMKWLYVTDGDRMYRRLSKRSGATVWTGVKPPPSRDPRRR